MIFKIAVPKSFNQGVYFKPPKGGTLKQDHQNLIAKVLLVVEHLHTSKIHFIP